MMIAALHSAHALLDKAERPLFFFDDDVDGLCSFLLLYRFVKRGKGIVLKTKPTVEGHFATKVTEYGADLVVVLDKSGISRDFVDACNVPIIWIDHHEPDTPKGVLVINPLLHDMEPYPTSYWCYKIVQDDLWIAETGCISDWQIVPEIHEQAMFLPIVPKDLSTPQDYLFNSPVGTLAKILMFNLKGRSVDVYKSIKVLTRINDPAEILEKKTPQGRFVYRRYQELVKTYNELLKDITSKEYNKIVLYTYDDDKTSLTSYLSNEILYRYPDKLTIIARLKGGEYKCSLRCSPPMNVRDMLNKALEEVRGHGGGHEQACGACIAEDDFSRFIELLEEQID